MKFWHHVINLRCHSQESCAQSHRGDKRAAGNRASRETPVSTVHSSESVLCAPHGQILTTDPGHAASCGHGAARLSPSLLEPGVCRSQTPRKRPLHRWAVLTTQAQRQRSTAAKAPGWGAGMGSRDGTGTAVQAVLVKHRHLQGAACTPRGSSAPSSSPPPGPARPSSCSGGTGAPGSLLTGSGD